MDFVDTAAIGLHWVASDGTILWANPADYEPLGYSASEYIGHSITEFHADPNKIADILTRLSANERIEEYEAPLRCKDGSIKHVAITSSVLFDEEEFVHTRCFTRDITERKVAEEQLAAKVRELTEEITRREALEAELRHANAMKDEFLAIASHELRTPLQTLKLNTQTFLRSSDLVKDEKLRYRLVKMDRQADRLVELVNTLLDVSRLGAGTATLDLEEVELVDVVRSVLARHHTDSREPSVEMILDAPSSVAGRWDRNRLEQVVGNLIGNAIKYGEGKPVRVTVTSSGETARLVVQDQGIGIDAEHHARIFERFERAVPAANYGGFGVGLWIVSQWVQAHRGTVTVTSSPGVGATFTVELPRN